MVWALYNEINNGLDPGATSSGPPTFGVSRSGWLMDQVNGISSDPSLIKGSARNTVKQ